MNYFQGITQENYGLNNFYYTNHTSTPNTTTVNPYQYNYFYPTTQSNNDFYGHTLPSYTYTQCTTPPPPPQPPSLVYQTYTSYNQQQQSPQITNKQEQTQDYIDSAYISQYSDPFHTNSSPSNISPINNQIINKVKSKKRKARDDEDLIKNTDEIVNKIFEEAATSQQHQQHQQQQQKHQYSSKSSSNSSKSDGSSGSKRPKILKIDFNLPNQLTDCQQLTNNLIQCTQCSLTFNSTAKLLMHQYKYHGNGSSTECPICFKKFGNQANALVHLRAHTQEKTYKCTQCDNAFCDSSTLKKHMRVHTGEKPYECKICCKKFTQSGNLKRHLSIHKKYDNKEGEEVSLDLQQSLNDIIQSSTFDNQQPLLDLQNENFYF